MKFEFVAKHRGAWPVETLCESIGVSRSGFYAWLSRPRSTRSLADEVLGAKVFQSFVASDRTYGARRVWHDVLELGYRCGLHRIERLMRDKPSRPGRAEEDCQRTEGNAARLQTTCSIVNFMLTHPIRNGWLTSLTSGRPKAGCMWRWRWTCTRGASWGGRCSRA